MSLRTPERICGAESCQHELIMALVISSLLREAALSTKPTKVVVGKEPSPAKLWDPRGVRVWQMASWPEGTAGNQA